MSFKDYNNICIFTLSSVHLWFFGLFPFFFFTCFILFQRTLIVVMVAIVLTVVVAVAMCTEAVVFIAFIQMIGTILFPNLQAWLKV